MDDVLVVQLVIACSLYKISEVICWFSISQGEFLKSNYRT